MNNIIFNRDNYGKDEYILLNGKKYTCLKKAKDKLSSCTNAKEYAEQMEWLALQVLVKHSIENKDLFAE
mgnify:CR=1 FL=1